MKPLTIVFSSACVLVAFAPALVRLRLSAGPAATPCEVLAETPALTAGPDANNAVLRFRILDEAGKPMPGRLTFAGAGGPKAELFPGTTALPADLAVRRNVIYSLSGEGAITVPPGEYTLYATHGIEWSRAETKLVFEAGREQRWDARLRHEVDPRGWISADFHLHTKTFSGHGDSNLEERVISLAGEGVELAVATDHNHNTDYQPTLHKLGAQAHFTALTGNEVSTPIGHFNAFPLDPARDPVDATLRDANVLFERVRAETNAFDVRPLIQLNHPRLVDIDFFQHNGLDPITGLSSQPSWSFDFDTIEVLNANPGRGYVDSDVDGARGDGYRHSTLQDWFNLLNRGRRYGAVGNSDSHTVHYDFCGYPRNYVPSSIDDPGRIDAREIAQHVRDMQSYTTLGPIVSLEIQDEDGNVKARSGDVLLGIQPARLSLRVVVRAASWIDVDRVKLVVNGDVIEQVPVAQSRQPLRLDLGRALPDLPVGALGDYWLAVLVEGDESLEPILVDAERPVRPVAIVNPVYIDADAGGQWLAPYAYMQKQVAASTSPAMLVKSYGASPSMRALGVLAALESRPDAARDIAADSLKGNNRRVVLAAARAAEELRDPTLLPALQMAWTGPVNDAYGKLVLLSAFRSCGAKDLDRKMLELLDTPGAEELRRHARELSSVLPGEYVREWSAIGYFAVPRPSDLGERGYGPETDPDASHAHAGKGGECRWRDAEASEQGLLDLRGLSKDAADGTNAISYAQTFLMSPDEREIGYALGTDDAGRVWINGELVHSDGGSHGAYLSQHMGKVKLRAGANRVVFEVANGKGATGLVLKVFDAAVKVSRSGE